MKKITLLAFLFMTTASISRAQIVNGNIEDWTPTSQGTTNYDSLNNWTSTEFYSLSNSGNILHSAQKETSDIFQGLNSIVLTSWPLFTFNGIPGAVSNGNVNIAGLSISPVGGVPDNVRHGQLSGFYKYVPGTGGDIASIEACLFKRNGNNRDTVAYGVFNPSGPVGTYTQFSFNFIALSTDVPDSSLIWIQSSPRSPLGTGKNGSKLYIDSLFYQGLIGVNEISPLVKSMMTYPVPASTELNVKVDLTQHINMNYTIVDVKGKIVLTGKMENETQKIDVSNLAAGHYIVNVNDDSGKKLGSHNFNIAR